MKRNHAGRERAVGQLPLWGREVMAELQEERSEQATRLQFAPRPQQTQELQEAGQKMAIARLQRETLEAEHARSTSELQEPGRQTAPSRLQESGGAERFYREWLYQWGQKHGWPAVRFQTRTQRGYPFYCTILGSEVSWRVFYENARYELIVQVCRRAEKGEIA